MKNFLNFLLCAALAVFVAYEISGSGGIFILVLLIIALVTSVSSLLVSVWGVNVELELSTEILNKGDSFEARLITTAKDVLPTCFIEVTLGLTPNIKSEDGTLTYKYISSKRLGGTIDIPLNAKLCGSGSVYIEQIVLSDYLGLFSKKLGRLPEGREIRIIPNIPDTGSQTEVLKSTSERISFDDSDEESDETSSALTGVPGYEHRQYTVGDPLKRINWKLSSKKDQLMVRLDEKVTSSSQVFQLDIPKSGGDIEESYTNADKITEAALALLSMLIRSGYESEFNYYIEGWEMAEIKDEKSLQLLQERLASLKPYPAGQRFPDHNINAKGKAMMCFTSCTNDMPKELNELADNFTGSLVVTKRSGIGKVTGDMWQVSDDFEFSKIQ